MNTKDVLQEQMVTTADFSNVLCALVREQLVGLVKRVQEDEFIFSLPGETSAFRVRVIKE